MIPRGTPHDSGKLPVSIIYQGKSYENPMIFSDYGNPQLIFPWSPRPSQHLEVYEAQALAQAMYPQHPAQQLLATTFAPRRRPSLGGGDGVFCLGGNIFFTCY